ncbi:MAG: GFA family protein [Pseudomonadota bacterium]
MHENFGLAPCVCSLHVPVRRGFDCKGAEMEMQGGCYCGSVRYEVSKPPLMSAQCHCRECQFFSGGGPNMYILLPPDSLAYSQGAPNSYARGDLDNAVTRQFCGGCGTHITTLRQDMPYIVLKAGTLDDPAQYGQPAMAIYTCDQQPFHMIPEGIPTFEGLPPRR